MICRVYKDAPNVTVLSSGPEPARKIEMKTFNFPDVGKIKSPLGFLEIYYFLLNNFLKLFGFENFMKGK